MDEGDGALEVIIAVLGVCSFKSMGSPVKMMSVEASDLE